MEVKASFFAKETDDPHSPGNRELNLHSPAKSLRELLMVNLTLASRHWLFSVVI